MIVLHKELVGSILDIGGGGEGFIGRVYGEQVMAIDHSQEELDEAPKVCRKALMDATDLKYESACFDNVTFFYSLMYMARDEQAKAIFEAARVLKEGGGMAIWDCEIDTAYPDPFLVDVDVMVSGEKYHTTYGIVKKDTQKLATIKQLCLDAGLQLIKKSITCNQFYLYFEKGESCR